MYLQDGYKLIRANQLLAALAALNTRKITFRAFRVYLASHELVAIREAAERVRGKTRRRGRRFRRDEISHLVAPSRAGVVSRELASLKRAGLLSFSENELAIADDLAHGIELEALLGTRGGKRMVPVPRKMLAFLASCKKPALAKTVVAYLLRGLSLDRSGELRGAGTVKVSWICALCQISERAARSARAELIRLGWISKDTGSFQRKLNRDGAYFQINRAWGRYVRASAPPQPKSCRENAPLPKRRTTPSEIKNQKLTPRDRSGFCEKVRGEKPRLHDIQPEDLRKPGRLRELFEQAARAGWVERSEANLLNFAAAAVRANRAMGDPVRIFVGIVRKGLWHHVSHQEEERGRAVLGRALATSRQTLPAKLHSSATVQDRAVPPKMSEGTTGLSPLICQGISEPIMNVLAHLGVVQKNTHT